MRLTVTTLSDEILGFEVSEDMELESFKALCEMETTIPAGEIVIFFNGRPLQNDKNTLKMFGVKDGDVLLLQRVYGGQGQAVNTDHASRRTAPFIDFSQIQIPELGAASSSGAVRTTTQNFGGIPENPATVRELLLSSPHDMAMLKERNPPLAEALLSGSLEKFSEVLKRQQDERTDRERARIRLIAADPFDHEAQQHIAEEIRLKNVEHNMETAMEHSPENFGQVIMLYVDCTVNGHPVKAFVDSGAQMTIMSQACAERCNIMRLVDSRWAGIAKGVGTQKIIGRVHLCQIQIGPVFLQSSFSILEDQPMDMLLGLDMLKRHQCIIDLKTNMLVIGTIPGTQTPFLGEADLPQQARFSREQMGSESMEDDSQLAEALSRSQAEGPIERFGTNTSQNMPGSAFGNTSLASGSGLRPGISSVAGPMPAFPLITEANILQLTSYGFARHVVVKELTLANGNIDEALAALFAKSINMP